MLGQRRVIAPHMVFQLGLEQWLKTGEKNNPPLISKKKGRRVLNAQRVKQQKFVLLNLFLCIVVIFVNYSCNKYDTRNCEGYQ